MDFSDFYAGKNDDDRRLDRVLRLFLKDSSLSEIYKIIRKGLVKVNDKKSKSDYRVKQGDKISIAKFLTNSYSTSSLNDAADFDIEKITVFQNEHILILDKPYDIKVHGDENSLDVIVKKYYEKNFHSTSLSFAPGPLHRLDRKTTGLIAFSMSLKGAKWFSENIKNHSIKKIYTGIVEGKLLKPERWEDFISKDQNENRTQNQNSKSFKTVNVSKTKNDEKTKNAVTIATPVKYGKYNGTEITLCEFEIETGRTHQIRSQTAAHGFPLLGDTAYGGKELVNKTDRDFFLHATKLILPENELGVPAKITSLPVNFPL